MATARAVAAPRLWTMGGWLGRLFKADTLNQCAGHGYPVSNANADQLMMDLSNFLGKLSEHLF